MTVYTKPGYATTEFWVTIVTSILGGLVTMGYIDAGQQSAIIGLLTILLPVAFYSISRALIKGKLTYIIAGGNAKAGYATTEFWLGLYTAVIAVLYSFKIIDDSQRSALLPVGVLIANAIVYILSRSAVKIMTLRH